MPAQVLVKFFKFIVSLEKAHRTGIYETMLIGVLVVIVFILIIVLAGLVLLASGAFDGLRWEDLEGPGHHEVSREEVTRDIPQGAIHVIGQETSVLEGTSKRGSAEEPAGIDNSRPQRRAWSGLASVCCPSSYAPTDTIRRELGWQARGYVGPVHLAWWLSPSCDSAREYLYTWQQGRQPCQLKNQLDESKMSAFVDKSKVFSLLAKKPENLAFTPRSWLIGDFLRELDQAQDQTRPVNNIGQVWPILVKDPDASVQMGVWVVQSREELEELVASTHTLRGNPRVTINQYVFPPLLWYDRPSLAVSPEPEDAGQGKKFHLRVFVIFLVRAGVVYTWVPDFMKIMTAKTPFVAGDWQNKDIHLTGGSRTLKEFWWERDASWHLRASPGKLEEIYLSARDCILGLAEVAASELVCYPESPAGYQLLGADILPDATGKCWFIEINRRPSWLAKNHDTRSAAIANMHARFQAENIIRPFFGISRPRRFPDGVFPAREPGELTEHVAELTKTSVWEDSSETIRLAGQNAGESATLANIFPGDPAWKYTGSLEAATVLRKLAISSRKLPASLADSSEGVQKRTRDSPLDAPVGLSWKNVGSHSSGNLPVRKKDRCLAPGKTQKKLENSPGSRAGKSLYGNCPRTAWVLPPDAPDAATSPGTLAEWLEELGMSRVGLAEARGAGVALAYGEPGSMNRGFGKDFNSARALMKSALGGREHLCDKTKLAATMRRVGGEKFLPRTWEFPARTTTGGPKNINQPGAENSKEWPENFLGHGLPEFRENLDLFMVKQRGSSGQEGVWLAHDEASYRDALSRCQATGGVVQEYIRRPLLSRGKKFHLRAYLAAYITGGVVRVYYATDAHKIMTARELYEESHWDDRGIHISGGAFTSEWLNWPQDIDCEPLETCTAQESLDEAMAALGRAAAETLYKYPDSLAGFHVFGVDILFRDQREIPGLSSVGPFSTITPEEKIQAIILEVNDRPGLGMKELDPSEYEALSRRWLGWLKQSIIGQHFALSYARCPLVAEAARPGPDEAGPPGRDEEAAGEARLVPYIHLLRGAAGYISIAPGLDSDQYELRHSDVIAGHLVRANSTDFFFVGVVGTWAWDSEMLTSQHKKCGLALLELAHSTITPEGIFTPKYNLVAARPEDLAGLKTSSAGRSQSALPESPGHGRDRAHKHSPGGKKNKSGGFRSSEETLKSLEDLKTILVVDHHYLPREYIEWLVPSWKVLKKPIPGEPIGWVAATTSVKAYPECQARLKGVLDDVEITDKSRLHSHFDEFPGALAETIEVHAGTKLPREDFSSSSRNSRDSRSSSGSNNRQDFPEGVPWIVRANWAWAGAGNRVVTTDEELADAYSVFSKKPEFLKGAKVPRVIASRYIVSPLLLPTGHKFHARVHAFIAMGVDLPEPLQVRACILHTIYLMSSEKKYRDADWANPEIHDTHGRYRDNFRALLEIFPQASELRRAAVETLSRVLAKMAGTIKLYPDARNAYRVYGADIMFTRDGRPIILEINDNPGIKATPEIESAIHAEILVEISRVANQVLRLGHDESAILSGVVSSISSMYPGISLEPPEPSVPIDLGLGLA